MAVLRLAALLVFGLAPVTAAHEFWIEPENFMVKPGAPVTAYLRNGEEFKGISLAYFESRFTRFEIVQGDETRAVTGRLGNSPALRTTVSAEGLMIVLHETTPSVITYREWEKFMTFARHKDFPRAEADHAERGLPKDVFRESYTRHAKALVSVGHGRGSDRAFGLETEFVAVTNPYDADFDGVMRVDLVYQGAPRPDAQVEVFSRGPDGSVSIALHSTDARGQAAIPVEPGHDYLFDAVVLRPASDIEDTSSDPVWETLWAALTFSVPLR